MLNRIVIIGPESTGKSTLSGQLAGHYQTAWVPEYARAYLDRLQRDYTENDLLTIARGQAGEEDAKSREARGGLLFCDTDLYVIKVWSEHRYDDCHPWILEQIAQRKYDLYLLTYIDIPWTADPQREHPQPEMRKYFYRIYRDIVINSGVPWVDIRGGYEQRLAAAIQAVDDLLAANKTKS